MEARSALPGIIKTNSSRFLAKEEAAFYNLTSNIWALFNNKILTNAKTKILSVLVYPVLYLKLVKGEWIPGKYFNIINTGIEHL